MTPQAMIEGLAPEQIEAFAAMWSADAEAAQTEVRALMDLFAAPKSHAPEIRLLLLRLLRGLVGPEPDLAAWLKAIAGGSFELRPEQKYAMPGIDERPARFIDRGRDTLDAGTSAAQNKVGITDATVQTGMNLILVGCIYKEFRNLALARIAIGTAWPLAAGVDKYLTNEEHRLLFQLGDCDELQVRMAAAARQTLREYSTEKLGADLPHGSREACHKRELPNGVDLSAHFTRADSAILRYRSQLMSALEVHFDATSAPAELPGDLAVADAHSIRNAIDPVVLPFSYLTNPDGSERQPKAFSSADSRHFQRMMPTLAKAGAFDELELLAARACHRRNQADSLAFSRAELRLMAEVREWVGKGRPPPADFPFEHASLFEEEAALLFVKGKHDLLHEWRELGFFPDPRHNRKADPEIEAALWAVPF